MLWEATMIRRSIGMNVSNDYFERIVNSSRHEASR